MRKVIDLKTNNLINPTFIYAYSVSIPRNIIEEN